MTSKSDFIARRKTGLTAQEIEKQATPWQVRYKRNYNQEHAIGPSPRIGPTIAQSSAPRFV